jgi:hypothetical protein
MSDEKGQFELPLAETAHPVGRPQSQSRRDSEYVVSDYGRRRGSREFFVNRCEAAQVQGTAHVIRHTVRTWLAEIGVPDAEANIYIENGRTKLCKLLTLERETRLELATSTLVRQNSAENSDTYPDKL